MKNNNDPVKQILQNKNKTSKSFNPILVVICVACFAVLMVFYSTEILKSYGFALFIGLPFIIGLFCSLLVCMQSKQSLGTCLIMSILGLFISSAILIIIAMEGMVCIILVLPLSLFLTLSGATFGYIIQELVWDSYKKTALTVFIIFIFPLSISVEAGLDLQPSLNEVSSSIIIDAPKEIVWNEVVTSELPALDELIFKTGMAYPIRAEIDGQGV